MAKATIASQTRFPPDLYEELKKYANRERESANSLVVEAVRRLLEAKGQ